MFSDASLLEKLKKYRESIFIFHAKFILEEYLEDWINKIINLRPSTENKYTAIIVDDRPGELIKFSIYNTLLMSMLKVKIILFTTCDNFKQMKDIFSNLKPWVTVIKLNDENNSLRKINSFEYNKILKNSIFWERLPTKNIIVFQTDSMFIEPIDFDMFKYDYVGAPFAPNKYLSTSFPEIIQTSSNHQIDKIDKWITQVFNNAVPIPDGIFIGNGGLSLRNRDVMIKICKNEYSPEKENEDIYFSRLVNKYSQNIVPLDIAKRFSCECTYSKSIGFHASYFYLTKEEQAEIYERHIKHIFALIDLPLASHFTYENS